MGQPPQRHRDRAQRAERDARIFRLKLAGGSERDIAKVIGVSPTTVHRVVSDRARATVQPLADEFRDLELARLDSALVRATAIMNDPKAMDGDRLKAVASVVRISESRRKLLGLDAPVSLDVAVEARTDAGAALVSEVLTETLAALQLTAAQQVYAMEHMAWLLGGREGALPQRPELPPAAPAPEPPVVAEVEDDGRAFRARQRGSADLEPDLPEAEIVPDEPEPPKADPEPKRWRRATVADPDAEAVKSWPAELRRSRSNAYTRNLVDHGRDPFNSPR